MTGRQAIHVSVEIRIRLMTTRLMLWNRYSPCVLGQAFAQFIQYFSFVEQGDYDGDPIGRCTSFAVGHSGLSQGTHSRNFTASRVRDRPWFSLRLLERLNGCPHLSETPAPILRRGERNERRRWWIAPPAILLDSESSPRSFLGKGHQSAPESQNRHGSHESQ